MANGRENLIPFSKRSKDEARRCGQDGGRASGEARRRKADFRKALNALLTAEIDSPEWTPVLEALGLDSTLESAVNAAMIKEALAGNVKAYEAVARYSGQSEKTGMDQEEQVLRMAAAKSKTGAGDEDEREDDGFLDALKGAAKEDWEDWANEGIEETDV